MAAARSASRRHGAASSATSPSFGRVPLVTRPEAFGGNIPFIFEGPITRTVEDAALAMTVLAGYDSRDPYCDRGRGRFHGRARAARSTGKKIAYTRDYGIFPVDPRVIAVVDKAVEAFEEAGAHVEEVKIGIRRSQRELSDVWCRFIAPKQVAALEGFKREGIDLVRDHHDDFPPEFWHWDEIGRKMTVTQFIADQIDAHRGFRCAAHRARPLRLSGLADARMPCRRQRDATATPSARRRSTASRSTA